ncbi:MAG: hypothetical protein JKY54_10330 [Flavobacteriales bacterium]|nr:hypothetical protein [Flavobacteriales bacterium]
MQKTLVIFFLLLSVTYLAQDSLSSNSFGKENMIGSWLFTGQDGVSTTKKIWVIDQSSYQIIDSIEKRIEYGFWSYDQPTYSGTDSSIIAPHRLDRVKMGYTNLKGKERKNRSGRPWTRRCPAYGKGAQLKWIDSNNVWLGSSFQLIRINEGQEVYSGVSTSGSLSGKQLEEQAVVKVILELKKDSSYRLLWKHNLAKWWRGVDSIWYNTGKYFIEGDFIFFTLDEDKDYLNAGKCDYPIVSMIQDGFITLNKKEYKLIRNIKSKHPSFEYHLKLENEDSIRFHAGWDMFEEVWINNLIEKK